MRFGTTLNNLIAREVKKKKARDRPGLLLSGAPLFRPE